MSFNKPILYIELFHTGLLADGRPNIKPVYINDLDVGYENQNRKVTVYIPVNGSILIPASSRSMLSFQEGTIAKFAQSGVIRAKMFYQPENFTTGQVPLASSYPPGTHVWNTTTKELWVSDGTNWIVSSHPTGAAGGDLSGNYPDPSVVGLQGYPIEGNVPTNGDALLFNNLTNQWEHAPIVFGGGPPVGPAGGDLGGLYPDPGVVGLQLDALPAKIADGFLKRNNANNAWEEVPYGNMANTVCEGDDSRLSDSRTPTGAAGGDLSGNYPNPVVDGLQTVPVDPTAPNTDEVLAYDGAKWIPTDLGSIYTNVKVVCGSFSDSTDQTIPNGTSTAVQFNTVELAGGVTLANNLLGDPTRITVPIDGIYKFDISPQLLHTGGTSVIIYFWAVINENPVARSASSLEMGNNNNRTLPFLSILLPMNAGQYLEWYFSASGTNATLEAYNAAGIIPAIPSVIANVTRISSLP